MATMTKMLRRVLLPQLVGRYLPQGLATAMALVMLGVIGAVIISIASIISYSVFSGLALEVLAAIMAQTCGAAGVCGDMPVMLSGLVVAVMILAVVTVLLIYSATDRQAARPPNADEISKAQLLLEWYSMTPRLREWMLHRLGASDADIDEGVIHLLKSEHEEIESMDGNY